MLAYTALCLTGVALFTTLEPGRALLGFALYVVANVGFEGALVFYNAYLPDIASRERRGTVSGLGFAAGYLGSALGLLIALQFVPERMDLVWVSTVAFFGLFSVPAFWILPRGRSSGRARLGLKRSSREGVDVGVSLSGGRQPPSGRGRTSRIRVRVQARRPGGRGPSPR